MTESVEQSFEALIEALGDGKLEVQQEAVKNLGKLGDRRAVDPLLLLLSEARPASRTEWFHQQLRGTVVEALGALKDPRATDQLLELLASGGLPLGAMAARALASIAGTGAVAPLSERLQQSRETAEQRVFATILGELADARAVPALVATLDHPDKGLASSALYALGSIGGQEAVAGLVDAVASAHPELRQSAAQLLGKLGVDEWQEIRGDDEDLFRLAERRHPRAIELLRSRLQPFNPELGRVFRTLLALGDDQAFDSLIGLARIRNRDALQVLCELDDPRACVPIISYALLDDSPEIRQQAVATLAQQGEKQWAAWIQGDDEDFLRLSQCPDPRIVEPLANHVRCMLHGVAAAHAVASIGDVRAAPILAENLKATRVKGIEKEQFQAVAAALQVLDPGLVVDHLIALLRQYKVDVWAAEALGVLGDARALAPIMKVLPLGSGADRKVRARALVRLVATCPELRGRWSEVRALVSSPHADHSDRVHVDQRTKVHQDSWTEHTDCQLHSGHADQGSGKHIQREVPGHADTLSPKPLHRDTGIGLRPPDEPVPDF